ncbi:sulfatase-like hydrolase/transferase [Lentibacter algarum]|uniref:sulfatase-like hydrolase/transferase n=1 Tax=Lentibacter algarum TaxID=576131 RepID=UPI001C09F966|nr:sulfatase-like hydrolase/transferase [Lentibacter algarum]MBU2983173.1 sulfatase-like hydrolase/transferase [Lentibacter algarum]
MPASQDIKNVILISFDDAVAFWKYKSAFGEQLQTPNLDRICAQSTAFQAAYCQAPVCSPSRASFMSGLSPHHTGVTGPYKHYFETLPPENMWPHRLKQRGFYCSAGGKVMQGYSALEDDIHNVIYSDNQKKFTGDWNIPERISTEMGGFRGGKAAINEHDDPRFYDHQVANSLRWFLKNYKGDAPFYRDVGFYGPHGPWITPKRFKDMYDYTKFEQPSDWADGFDENAFMDETSTININASRKEFWQKSVRNYFSALSHTDYQLGRIWKSIKRSRHAANTLVVIVSDHGLHLGERNRFRKHTLWEQVANVPLIIHDPRNPVAQVVSDPVALLDVGPTVMDYLGQPPIEGSIGRSLRPQVEWERAPDRAVPTFLHDSASVRRGKYRFIRYADGSTQFFDLSKDWWQTRDLGSKHKDYALMKKVHADCCLEYGFDVAKAEAGLAA